MPYLGPEAATRKEERAPVPRRVGAPELEGSSKQLVAFGQLGHRVEVHSEVAAAAQAAGLVVGQGGLHSRVDRAPRKPEKRKAPPFGPSQNSRFEGIGDLGLRPQPNPPVEAPNIARRNARQFVARALWWNVGLRGATFVPHGSSLFFTSLKKLKTRGLFGVN